MPSGAVYRWQFRRRKKLVEIAVGGRIIVNDSSLDVSAANKGLGLAYTAAPLAGAALEQGHLESVLRSYCPETPGIFLYFPTRAQALPKLRAFLGYARKNLELRYPR